LVFSDDDLTISTVLSFVLWRGELREPAKPASWNPALQGKKRLKAESSKETLQAISTF
jgi:hypothetical protein